MDSSDLGPTRVLTTTGGLMRRVLVGVVLSALAFVVVHWTMSALLHVDGYSPFLVAVAISVVVTAWTLVRTIGRLVATQADLQARYEAALVDALRDPLTGLGNHRAFHEELEREVATARRYQVPTALLLIDLDEFKAINDRRGHAGGDRVLRGFGQLLEVSLRRADRAFRVGGDEFAVLLPHTDSAGARIAARRVLAHALQPPRRLAELEPISFSGGISALPALATTSAELYSQADAALYAAKRAGRTDVVTYDPTMELQASVWGGASAAVAEVISYRQLRAVYQPIVSLADGAILGVEGLIRPVPPAPFVDPPSLFAAAEASGRLTALDLVCIDTIVAGARGLPAEQFLSINLSPPTLEGPEFSSGALLEILARHQFPPDRLIVELTERQQLSDPERVRVRLQACRRAGIRFAADDIGAGNAGLRLLAEVRFDILKVDLSLVQRSGAEGPSNAVLGSVVELATRTGALVVAEGVEQARQVDALRALGIEAGQGYHLGRPAPLEVLSRTPAPVGGAVAAWRRSIGLSAAR